MKMYAQAVTVLPSAHPNTLCIQKKNKNGLLAVQDEAPLQLYMHGVDLYMNSHFDVWIVDIDQWKPGPIDEDNWRVPDFCHQGEFEELQRHQLDSSLVMEVAKQLPNPHFGELACLRGQETCLAEANSSCPFHQFCESAWIQI